MLRIDCMRSRWKQGAQLASYYSNPPPQMRVDGAWASAVGEVVKSGKILNIF